LELRDADGVWLAIDKAQLGWDLPRLLAGELKLDHLSAEHVAVNRLPPLPVEAKPPNLPLAVAIDQFAVARLDLAAAVSGIPASLRVDGGAAITTLNQATIQLVLQRLDSNDQYRLAGKVTPETVAIQANITESRHGLLAGLAGLQHPYPVNLDARLQGVLSAVDTRLQLSFGPLRATAQGLLDFNGASTQLDIAAQSSGMQLLPGLAWQAAALSASVTGALPQADVDGKLDVQKLNAAMAEIGKLNLAFNSHLGQIHLTGDLAQLKSPQLAVDPLQNQPLKLSADFNPAQANKPLTVELQHPSFNAVGSLALAGQQQANLNLSLTNLKPLALLTGLDLQGKAEVKLNSRQQGKTTDIDGSGTLTLTGGDKRLRGLLGQQGKISLKACLNDTDTELSNFDLKGGNLIIQAQGKAEADSLKGDYRVAIQDLAALDSGLTGKLALAGQISGPADNFAVTSDLTGDLGYQANGQRFPPKAVTGKLQLNHLPKAADGRLDGKLWLAGSPLDLAVAAKTSPNGLQLGIERADWQSARLQGQLTVPPTAGFAIGKLDFKMAKLAELRPLLGLPLSGGIDGTVAATLNQGHPAVQAQILVDQFKLENSLTVGLTTLTLNVNDLLKQPSLDGRLKLDGIANETVSGGMKIDLKGLLSSLELQGDAALTDPAANPIKLTAAGLANTAKQQLKINRFQADWRRQTLALLEPVQVGFTDGLSLDRLRLGLKQAILELSGQLGPNLDMTASLERLPADLLALASPGLDAAGSLSAHARLTGSYGHPTGSIELNSSDIKLRNQQFSLPPIQLAAKALLDGVRTDLSGHASAGDDSRIDVTGQIPLAENAPLNLHGAADINLKLADPLLTPSGRRIRGHAKLTADLTGNPEEPRYTSHLQLDKTELLDYALGLKITRIAASAQADNGLIRVDQFKARAGQGQISAQGSIDLTAEGMPVDLAITSDKAQLLASERLSVNLDSDLKLKGEAQGKLLLLGSILVNRAEIRIPERLPTNIAVLKIQQAKTPATPPPAKANTRLGLNLAVTAPGNIFVRGRGLNAELYGTVRLTGPVGQPYPEGAFKLRRGDFSLAGKTLNFSEGSVSFDGGSLTDPSLNFVASSYSDNINATLTVGGTASKPKISLSSVPALPQDEILARLLFNNSTANLSVTEMVQIGSALASLSGADSALTDPLEGVRKTLGLDRLSVGASLEAGRYLAPGVYLGAKQGFTGSNPQATIQIDLTKQLKLEASVGTGTSSGATTSNTQNTNSIGIIYQYEY